MSLSHCKDTQGKCLSYRGQISSKDIVLEVVFYCIPLRDLLAKLNIKHKMCCNKPIDCKMIAKFFLYIIAWLYGEGGNSHILAYIKDVPFLWHSVLAGK